MRPSDPFGSVSLVHRAEAISGAVWLIYFGQPGCLSSLCRGDANTQNRFALDITLNTTVRSQHINGELTCPSFTKPTAITRPISHSCSILWLAVPNSIRGAWV